PQMPHPRGGDRQRTRPSHGTSRSLQAQVKHALALSEPLPRRRLERLQLLFVVRGPGTAGTARTPLRASNSCSSCADPRCSILRDPRRDEYTICTAVAPEAVFTVRM